VGDINHSNALVNGNALVHFIDADSFQVRHQGTLHRCTVGVPEFTPPELQGLNLSTVERTAQHDRFGLAILIFKLLFMGRHPFAGRFTRGDVSLPNAIEQGLFAYSITMANEATPPPNSLDLQDVGEHLATLFDRAFLTPLSVEHGRPDGQAWVRALKLLQSEINRCRRHPHHYYPGGAGACIWCDFSTIGIDYFPDSATQPPPPIVNGTGGRLTIDDAMVARLWAAVMAVPKRPGFDESIQHRNFELAPLPPLKATSGWPVDGGVGCWSATIVGVAFVIFGPAGLLVAGGLAAVYALVGPALQQRSIAVQEREPQRMALEEQMRRRVQLQSRLSAIPSTISAAVQEHERSWQRLMSDLGAAHDDLVGRDAARAVALRSANESLAVAQKELFLQSKLIRTASIPGVGDTITSNLISYGFESAYDVLNAGSSGSTSRKSSKSSGSPDCPRCGSAMRRCRVRRGGNAGNEFWGCPRYPNCRGTRNINYTSYSAIAKTSGASTLENVPGIGPVRAADITRWARQVEQQFRPRVEPAALARESQRIEAVHCANVQRLAQQLRGGPAELTSINSRFSAKVSSYVVQLETIEKEW
jgi:DNA-binding helix-hairpin-helix protein with protein kinase domain